MVGGCLFNFILDEYNAMPRIEKEIIILSEQGLHARPAALFVQIAVRYEADITVMKNGETVNGKSIMGLLMLGAEKNSKIIVTADGPDAAESLAELEGFLNSHG